MRLENKVAIITGAGGGQGRTAALLFAREGAKIVASDWNAVSGEETAAQVTGCGRGDTDPIAPSSNNFGRFRPYALWFLESRTTIRVKIDS